MCCMYYLNYLDQTAIASARLNNLEADLGLDGSQYNTYISISCVAYLLIQLPSNMLMASSRVRPSWYIGICMAIWDVTSALTSITQNHVGLVVVRFFLGVAEAPFYPGALFLLSIFYTRKEIATRMATLYSANIIVTDSSGFIAAATFSTIDDAQGIAGWRWPFIIEGSVTVAVALCAIPILPDHPLTPKRLTTEERQIAHDLVRRDTVQVEAGSTSWQSLKVAFSDPRLYLLALMQNLHLSANGFTNFFPTVVRTLGFDKTLTLVLTSPPFIVSAIAGPLWGLSSGRFNECSWHITSMMVLAMVGSIISASALNVAERYVACFCYVMGVYAVNSCILGWVSATLGQTMQKKAISFTRRRQHPRQHVLHLYPLPFPKVSRPLV